MPHSKFLVQTVEQLSSARTLEAVTGIVSQAARHLAGAQGSTLVLREDDKCFYVDEDAISPLWKGKRFPIESCISGWCMLNAKVVVIPDIYQDDRIPKDAYRPTFVKSLCMVPIREEDPVGAIGNYWSDGYQPTPEQVKLLQILANSCATALENLELRRCLAHERDDKNQRNRDFEFQLHSIAHDLKSPLATVMGFAELLQMRLQPTQEKELEYASSIQRVSHRINRQIERIMSLSRLSHQPIRKRRVDLSAMAQSIVNEIKSQTPERPTEIEIEPDVFAAADPDLMHLALENLIANAFKYSAQKDSTFMRFGKSEQVGSYFIEDHGDGFDPSNADKIFQPFVRLHDNSRFEGTGLGLASVRKILELHHGKIRAEGRPGIGARFIFSLPE